MMNEGVRRTFGAEATPSSLVQICSFLPTNGQSRETENF